MSKPSSLAHLSDVLRALDEGRLSYADIVDPVQVTALPDDDNAYGRVFWDWFDSQRLVGGASPPPRFEVPLRVSDVPAPRRQRK